jgi:hypothetical protein
LTEIACEESRAAIASEDVNANGDNLKTDSCRCLEEQMTVNASTTLDAPERAKMLIWDNFIFELGD